MDCTCGNLGPSLELAWPHMVSLAVLALEVIYVFVIVQMVELLDTAANIAVYLTSGASARI